MTTFNTMQLIKRRFFAMRNGALADNMRRAGAPYRIIFGLNLPQIVEIARDFTPDADLAWQLWNNTTTRESMLMAPMIFPREQLDVETARRWVSTATTPETVDILCHRLLRHLPDPLQMIYELADSDTALQRYAAIRLALNIMPDHADEFLSLAEREAARNEHLTAGVCRMLIEEIKFINEVQEY